MRSKLLALVVAGLCALPGLAQTNAAAGKVAWRAQLGGGSAVLLDTVTALPKLLDRLKSDWQFVETFKGYWIGYTDDMYSIAAHGEAAVGPLVKFIQATPSFKARYGAVYCLHLIGIHSNEAGRMHEDFRSLTARQALRNLLIQDDLRHLVIKLLIRDPWQSDVPYLMAALEKRGTDDWALVNSLVRYRVTELPIQQPIPADIGTELIKVPKFHWRLDFRLAANEQMQQVVGRIRKLQPVYITVEDSLEQAPLSGSTGSVSERELPIREFLYRMTEVDYLQTGSRLHYFVDKDGLTICSTQTACKRLLAWWHAQTPEYRQQFKEDAAKQRLRSPGSTGAK